MSTLLAMGLVLETAVAGGAGAAPRTPPRATDAGSPVAATSGSATAGPGLTGRPATVTLLTGDRVTVTASGAASVRPAAGRSDIRFVVNRDRERLSVVPQDALPLLRSGRLDPRLFDVTELIAAGYDDANRDDLPLLVTYRDGVARRSTPATGIRTVRDLPAIDGAAALATKATATVAWSALTVARDGARVDMAGGVDQIWLDGRRQLSLDRSVPQIGAPAAHQAGWTGRGVTVAVLDTGVDDTHPDLAGKVAESRNFSDEPDARDTVGHGTHVASTIAGSGAASGGRYRGVAPDATLLSGKVCGVMWCLESSILAGMHWAATDQRASVINMSLGGQDLPGLDPLEEAVNTLTAQTGALFVISAGNDGSEASVGSPSSAEAALSVGAVDVDDQLAEFSSRGPAVQDDGLKPEITAPGVEIVAARAEGTSMGGIVDGRYTTASGTSMSAPHVVGAAALLAQQHPDWAAGQLKATLMASAKPHPELTAYQQGAGRVDVARAIAQTVTTDPVGVSLGRALWPHTDDTPLTRTLTYHNAGASALDLELATEVNGPTGAPAPAGMFRLSADRLTVPAGGQAQVTVTADTRVAGPDGHFTGRILARSGTLTVNTPLAVNKEVESYPVTFRHRDQTGAAADDYSTFLFQLGSYRVFQPFDPDGDAEIRLPKGRYNLSTFVWTAGADGNTTTANLVQPVLQVDGAAQVDLDARLAKPVRMTVPDSSAKPAFAEVSTAFFDGEFPYGTLLWADDFDGLRSGQLGSPVSGDQFVAAIAAQWADLAAAHSPYLYAMYEAFPGRMPTGFVRDYRPRDLATVTHTFRGDSGAGLVERVAYAESPAYPTTLASGVFLRTTVPGKRVEHYNARGVHWGSELQFGQPNPSGWVDLDRVLMSWPAPLRAGRKSSELWNTAPYGPSFLSTDRPIDGISRQGNELRVNVPLHSDANGHPGISLNTTGRTALYRGGTLVGETADPGWGWFEVPADTADYRLEAVARQGYTDLSTEVGATWTFRSGPVAGDDPVKLPAMAVRFSPRLDERNTAPANRRFTLGVSVDRQTGGAASKVRSLTVQVSYDGGRSWQNAAVKKAGSGWAATVTHPAGSGHASLRATATDRAGNTVTQHILNAYRLG